MKDIKIRNYREHLIKESCTIKEALIKLDLLASDSILFIVDINDALVGSLTDGDIRRALLKGTTLNDLVITIIQKNPKYINASEVDVSKIISYRQLGFKILPVINQESKVVDVLNFRNRKSYLPVDAVIMAGGRGTRLLPLTEKVPKPLLEIGDKAIIEHNMERLYQSGIDKFWISVGYLGEKIKNKIGFSGSGNSKIEYILEENPLGTIGAVSKIINFRHNHILITNSDILTNLDYESFYLDFVEKDADMSIVSIPYKIDIPYAVLKTQDYLVNGLEEKPTYTYFSNAGIYLIKKSYLDLIPHNKHFDATELIDCLIRNNKKVISYEFFNYWLDIGKTDDFEKAQRDLQSIQF